MDFYSAFITSIITLKLINFGKVRIVVLPGLHDLIKRHLLVDQGHIVQRRCGIGGQLNVSRQAWFNWLLLCNISFFYLSCFVRAFFFGSRKQGKAVITVPCRANAMEKTSEVCVCVSWPLVTRGLL